MSAFDDVIAEAVAWFVEHGFRTEEEYRIWERRISDAIDAKMHAPGFSDKPLQQHLGVWSRHLLEHPYRVIRRLRYGPSSTWKRHDDRAAVFRVKRLEGATACDP